MIHLNEAVKDIPGSMGMIARAAEIIMPEVYIATTLADFVENRDVIVPTRKIFPVGVFAYGEAMISVESSVVYHEVDSNIGTLSDLTHSIDIRKRDIRRKKFPLLADGKRIYNPMLVYRPRDDRIQLFNFKEHGPIEPERDEEELPDLSGLELA